MLSGVENEAFLLPLIYAIVTVYIVYRLFWQKFHFYNPGEIVGNSYFEIKKDIVNHLNRRKRLRNLPPPYPNGWFCIMESKELKMGKTKKLDLLGLNLVAWRSQSGKAYVADAYCPHLGAHLGVGGTVCGETIVCPFHGWKFEGETGSAVEIPYCTGKIPAAASIKIRESAELNGFLYLWFAANDQQPYWRPPSLPQNYSYRGKAEFIATAHIQDVIENQADMSHFNILHAHAMDDGLTQDPWLFWGLLRHTWSGKWEPGSGERDGIRAFLSIEHKMRLVERFEFAKVVTNTQQFGPAISHSRIKTALGEAIMVQHVTPMEPLKQHITQHFFAPWIFPQPLAKFIMHVDFVQVSRDVSIWSHQTYTNNPVLTKEDASIKSFRAWYRQFYLDSKIVHAKDYMKSTESGNYVQI